MSIHDPYTAMYERGFAYGHSDVKTDTMVFTFKSEKFEFPTTKAFEIVRWNGYFYEANIEDVRRLEAEQT